MTFADPLAFLLLPAPLAVLLWAPAGRLVPAFVLHVPDGVAAALERQAAPALDTAGRGLSWLCWALLVMALAGPQALLPIPALPSSGREIYLVIDISGSMSRADFELDGKAASRLDTVRSVAADFIGRRAGDRIGLVLFAEQTYLGAPASFDLALVRTALAEAAIGVVGTSTAIGDGLGLALKRLRASDAGARLVILLSDGSNTAGRVRPEDAAKLAGDLGIRVHAIGLGTEDRRGGPGAEADAVDYPALQAIAAASGGQAFRVRTTAELGAVYRAIEALEATSALAPPAAVARALWLYPAALAFAVALALLWQRGREP